MDRRSARRRAARVALALLAATGLVACGSGGSDAGLPDVAVVPLGGGDPISLSDIEGPAVVNLWATWCAPCRREIPDFQAVHLARGDEVRFVGVNVGEDADRAAEFVAEVGATYDQFLDGEGRAVTELETSAMPVTLVIDADGDVSTRHLGPMDQDDLNAAIDGALAGDGQG